MRLTSVNAKRLYSLPPFELRSIEANECKRFGLDPVEALKKNISESVETSAIFLEGKLVAVWGYRVSSYMSGTALPWVLATKDSEHFPYRFARSARFVFDYLLRFYNCIEVTASKEHDKAIRLLMKNKFLAIDQYDAFDMTFIIFKRERNQGEGTRH